MRFDRGQVLACFFVFVAFAATSACTKVDLYEAVVSKNHKAIDSALKGGANPNAKNAKGLLALQAAVAAQDAIATEMLVGHGADVRALDASGKSALDLAIEKAFPDPSFMTILKLRTRSYDDSDISVLRQAMYGERRGRGKDVTVEGQLSVAMELQGFSSDGAQLEQHVTIAAKDGSYALDLSSLETRYDGLELVKRRAAMLDLGEGVVGVELYLNRAYRATGVLSANRIETSSLGLVSREGGGQKLAIQIEPLLPSTVAVLRTAASMKGVFGK